MEKETFDVMKSLHSFRFLPLQLTLRFSKRSRFRFLHGATVCAFLKHRWNVEGNRLPEGVTPVAVESGRVEFEPGEDYNFGLTFVGYSNDEVMNFLSQLKSPGSSSRDLADAPLGSDMELTKIVSLKTASEVGKADDLAFVDLSDLEDAVQCFQSMNEWTIRFVSPARIKSRKNTGGHQYLDRMHFDPARMLRILYGRLYDLLKLQDLDPGVFDLPSPPELSVEKNELLWLDLPYAGGTLGGVCGRVVITGSPGPWAPLLVIGQYLQVGKNTSFGLGSYRIDGIPVALPFAKKAHTLLDLAFRRAALQRAREEAIRKSAQRREEAWPRASAPPPDADKIAELVREGSSRKEPLHGFILERRGKKRTLAVPSIADRVAQRAVLNLVAPAVDQLLEDSSFAYRKGFSRQGAARFLRKAYEDGYRFGLKSDIRDFFDEVDWETLKSKLDALFPDDPITELLMDWVRRPVLFQGKLIEREKGLPQGAVISPLLSNLFLDQFDENLLAALKEAMTYAASGRLRRLEAEEAIPLETFIGEGEKAEEGRAEAKTHLTVIGWDKSLHFEAGRLTIRERGEKQTDLPWRTLRSISCVGRVRVSPAVIHACGRDDVLLSISDSHGNLLGVFTPYGERASPMPLIDQVRFALDEARCLDYAKEVVAAKIKNQNVIIRRQEGVQDEKLVVLARRCAAAGSVATLMGIEGRAAALYFGKFKGWVAPFSFPGRTGRHARDPVNALLNFGYSLLYKQSVTALAVSGLAPAVGFFHRDRRNYGALAADLMEEFRFIAEALALRMIHRSQIKPEDFEYPKGHYPCVLKRPARNNFLMKFEERMASRLDAFSEGRAMSLREWIYRQAEQLKALARGGVVIYRAFRIR